MPISPAQSRGARGLLGISQGELASASGVSLRTIQHFEMGQRQPIPATLGAMQGALEAAGVEFTNGDEPGVKLRLAKRKGKKR
jgi:transcriptional regulator with XRE-family HTH domain